MRYKFVLELISQLELIKEKNKSRLKLEDFFNIKFKYNLFAANSIVISTFLLINLANLLFFLTLTLAILKALNKLLSRLLDIILKKLGLN